MWLLLLLLSFIIITFVGHKAWAPAHPPPIEWHNFIKTANAQTRLFTAIILNIIFLQFWCGAAHAKRSTQTTFGFPVRSSQFACIALCFVFATIEIKRPPKRMRCMQSKCMVGQTGRMENAYWAIHFGVCVCTLPHASARVCDVQCAPMCVFEHMDETIIKTKKPFI